MKAYIKDKLAGTFLASLLHKVRRHGAPAGGRVSEIDATEVPPPDTTPYDLTRSYDYDRLLDEEKEHYSKIEVTDRLTEGGVHAHAAWEYYWGRVSQNIEGNAGPYTDMVAYLERSVPNDRTIQVLSLGSGYCGQEIMMAGKFSRDYAIACVDINPDLFQQARVAVEQKGLKLSFEIGDLNFITIQPRKYDLVFAHAVLHHVINLEHLYAQVAGGLTDRGVFHIIEVVGKNRMLIWENNQSVANKLLDICPEALVATHRILVGQEEEGMEGVRQEEILVRLKDYFAPEYEYAHGAFMRYVCLHPKLGPALCPTDPESRKYLDFLIDCDESCVQRNLLKPLEIWGVYRPRQKKD